MADLLILAHGGSWEMRFQISSLAASAAAAGERVDVALFFGALDAWARGRWDELDPRPPLTAARLEALAMPPLSGILASGRQEGLEDLSIELASQVYVPHLIVVELHPEPVVVRVQNSPDVQEHNNLSG